ncbi:MAG: trigger factor [Kiritimatiellae bacterium]|nr:trigger factor [Kiritimatiellia bacterium]
MKVEKKESSPCVLELSVKAEADEVKEEYQKVLTAFIKNAMVPGFRKGKTPLPIIKQKFQTEISQETQQACFHKLYPEALKEASVEPLSLQDVTELSFSPETGFAFTALVEVRPVFDLPKYKKLAIKPGDLSVSDDQVTAELENYRRAFAKYEDAKEGAVVAEGDFVCFDYTGTTDDDPPQPLSELVPDQKAVCAGTDFWTQVEEGRFVPEILEALKGMKAGETKEGVKVSFPQDAAPEPLQGRTAVYTITLKSFRSRTLPDDAGFVAAAKAESMDALRADFRTRLEEAAKARDLAARKDQAIDLLLAKSDFDVPPSLVRRQTQSTLEELAQRAQYSGLPADYFQQNRDQILADATNTAIRRVRLSYILLGIAKEEGLEITEEDVMAGLEKMAASTGGKQTAADLRKQVEENGQLAAYREQLAAEKALDFVLAQAK